MNQIIVVSEKDSKECLGEGLVFNGSVIATLVLQSTDTSFIQTFKSELLGLALLGIGIGFLLKFWFRSLSIIDIRSNVLLRGFGNKFFYKKEILLRLSNIKALKLTVDSYFSSLSTRHIKIKLIILDKLNNSYYAGEGSDKFWALLYRSAFLSKYFQIPLDCDLDLNSYLHRIGLPKADLNDYESLYKSKAIIEQITDFLIWCGIALVPFMIAITIFILVGPKIT